MLRRITFNWRKVGLAALLGVILTGASAAYVFRPMEKPAAPRLDTLDASLEEGRYLATIGNCAACHTVKGKADYAGGVRFETDFGAIYSTNITPDARHGIGGWSYAQFRDAMKHGVRPDGTHLYPAFPYTSFARLSDADIASLYLYFMSLKPEDVPNRPNAMKFPFGNRELLYFWKRLFHDDATFAPRADKSPAWNRGAYLVEGPAHCGACHTPRNMLGGLDQDRALEGGTYTDRVASGQYRTWAAVDITAGERGLANWSHQDIAAYLKTGKNRHAVVHGPMGEVIESTRHLTDADAQAIADYLKGTSAGGTRIGLPSLSFFGTGGSKGEVMYTVHCGTCHLPEGQGDRILGVPLAGNPVVQAHDPSSLINVVLYGPDLPPPPFASGRTRMPPFGKRLSDEDIAAIATYLRSQFGNQAGAVTPEQVLEQR
ncbi:cytochrome c [Novosphingobium endophyticum]|uniref:Cytochrome c n=1 Tax=Novosphingobium endophyticum TaxID=1955250 RepID=A0A916TQD3_9SPHN|nr:cytochrome c [Novosphingobium endophyticum]GGB87330.1 cytochrome c [Novosphingobium endophyticum]